MINTSIIRLKSNAISELSSQFDLPEGLWQGIFIVFDGVNNAGQTLTSDNLGTVQTNKNNLQKDNVSFERLVDILNLEYGAVEETSVAAQPFRHVAYLPFHMFQDMDTALIVREGDKLELRHDYPQATSTIVSSGNVTYYGVKADNSAITFYETRLVNNNQSLGSAGTIPEPLRAENVAAVYIENDTNLTSLSVTVDGEQIISNVQREDLYSITQLFGRLETFSTTTPLIKVQLNSTQNPVSTLANKMLIEYVTSAGTTIDVVSLSVFPTPNKEIASLNRSSIFLNRLQSVKANQGAAISAIRSNLIGISGRLSTGN